MLALANKLTNSTQPIYRFVNKYSIDFDGVDDRIITDGADTVLQNTTYSFWCKTTTTGQNIVFAHGYYQRGGFAFNWSSNRPILRIGADKWIIWNDTSAQYDGEWHHWVVYLNAENITESKLYVDATLQTVSATSNTGSIDAYTTSLIIGNDGGAFDYTGKIDEFAVYDRELTQAEITRMYNTYYSPNRVANGNFSQIGNEEITNGDFSQIGSEEVTNGDFATDSDWSKGTGITISGGSANFTGNANTFLTQSGVVSSSKTYKATFTVSNYVSGAIDINLGGSTRQGNISANGSYVFYITVPSGNILYFQEDFSNGFVGSIDNVSVKEVGQDWEFTDGATITSNGVRIVSDGTYQRVKQDNVLTVGKQYKIQYEIVEKNSGNLKLANSFGLLTIPTTVGVHTVYGEALLTFLGFERSGACDITLTNVSVKEVGQGWTVPTGWSIENDKAVSSSDNNTFQTNSAILTENATFKVTFNITYTSGTLNVDLGSGSSTTSFNSGGFKTATLIASGFNRPRFYGGNFVGSIDNIVVQELKHDATNLMLNAGAYQSANPLITSTKSMEFDGTDDYLDLGVQSATSSLTYSAWVYCESNNSNMFSYGKTIFRCSNTTELKYWSDITQSNITLTVDDYFNKWTHFVVTQTGTTYAIYQNGIQKGTGTAAAISTTQDNSYIGRFSTQYFDGKLTEAGIYDRALTSLEVASLYNQGMPTNLLVNRNNYQSGNPTVFNTKQVDFDGTDDYMVSNITSSTFTGSVSAWVNRDGNAGYQFIVDFRGEGNTGTGAFYFDTDSDTLASISGTLYVDGVAGGTVPTDGNWHHAVATGMSIVISEPVFFSRYSLSNTFNINGKMSQIGLWNSTLTADEVSSLYNHGLPIDLTTNQAAYESSSNLVGYWRMGSGLYDNYPSIGSLTYGVIADQTNATLGDELIVNGDFATDSNWTKGAGWTISGGKASRDGSGGVNSPISQLVNIVAGKVYKLSYDRTYISGGGQTNLFSKFFTSGSHTTLGIYSDQTQETVTITSYFSPTYTGSLSVNVYGIGTFTGTVDNVSLKEFGGNPAIMTNQTSSDIENGSPYANIVQNSDFSDTSFWTVETPEAEISNGKVNFNTTLQNYGIYKTSLLTSSVEYKVVFTIDSYTSGAVHLNIGGSVVNSYNAIDTYTAYVTGGGTNVFGIQSDSGGAVLSINNVTITEVNTGLQGYWKMGDGTNDKYPYIYDQVDPTLGSEKVVNGSFTGVANGTDVTTLTNWNAYGSPTSRNVVDNKLVIVATGGNQGAYYSLGSLTGTYKLSVDVTGDVGAGGIYISAANAHNVTTLVGTLQFAFVASGSTIIFFRASANSTGTTSYTNISVKKVNGNLATMTNMVEGNITNQYPLTKIRNYYRMGDGILDGYPIIQDQTSPNLAHIPTTNLVTYSEDFSNAAWVKTLITFTPDYATAPDGTETAYRLVSSGGSYPQFYFVLTGLTIGQEYTVSFYVKSDGTTQIEQSAHISGVSPTITFTPTNDWVRIEYTRTATANSHFSVIFTASGSAAACSYLIWGYQIEQQSQATAYIKSDGIAAIRKSSTTNLVPYSEDFSQSVWAKNSVGNASAPIITTNYATSPDGTQNASRLQLTVSGSTSSDKSFLENLFNLDGSSSYTLTFYIKSNNGSNQNLIFLQNSVSGNAITATNQWVRIQQTVTSNTTNSRGFGLMALGNIQQSVDVIIFGAQLEQQTQAETYAKTTGLPVTIDLFTENNYGTMTNMSASDIVEDTPNN